jgi:RNA polymerase sigma-70 factor (ECF subfamily)
VNDEQALELWKRFVGQDDHEAFAALYEFYCPRLIGFATRLVGHRHDAEDVVSAKVLQLLNRPEQIPVKGGGAHVRNWLYRVVRNACADRLRRLGRLPYLQGAGGNPDEGPPLEAQLAAADPEPPELLATEEGLERLRRCLRRLPDPERLVVVALFEEGVRAIELASDLRVAPSTITNRKQRALRLLLACLEQAA